MIRNLSHECVQHLQMMKNDQHIGNVTIFFFLREGQVATPTCCFHNALQMASLLCSRKIAASYPGQSALSELPEEAWNRVR